jgi:hypothetical protein
MVPGYQHERSMDQTNMRSGKKQLGNLSAGQTELISDMLEIN